jgi:hypothetical protein
MPFRWSTGGHAIVGYMDLIVGLHYSYRQDVATIAPCGYAVATRWLRGDDVGHSEAWSLATYLGPTPVGVM